MGRDLVLTLMRLAKIPPFIAVWRSLLYHPAELMPKLTGEIEMGKNLIKYFYFLKEFNNYWSNPQWAIFLITVFRSESAVKWLKYSKIKIKSSWLEDRIWMLGLPKHNSSNFAKSRLGFLNHSKQL